ncbi:MAG TPA: Cna B-type domain-containing protein [Ligilactobacillus acidipiscis]|uniref:Cna B-type domain-containing protein n=1 Tax=Ligilactobacillus acidipiscis TaxID=89059 RepID=A0A921FAT7_9LACO|nr:Cna B-type domain-containing protein [Ligilactobacillus acidipiscis]
MSNKKAKYLTKLYALLMSLTLVAQLFMPLVQVTAAEVQTGITSMAAKTKGDNEAELNLSLYNPNEENKAEKISLSSDARVKQIPATKLVNTNGENVGTYQIKDQQIDFDINGKVSTQVKVPVVFADDNTASQVIFTSGQLNATVNLANKQSAPASNEQEMSKSSETSSSQETSNTSVNSSSSSSTTTANKPASAKKSVSKVQAQAEKGEDISKYLPESSKGTIITGAEFKFSDAKGNDITEDQITPDSQVSLKYLWAIPNELRNGHSIKAGDYFEFKLPANVQYKPESNGNLGDYGSYSIQADGTVRLTFNEKVENVSDIHGTFEYSKAQLNINEPGENEITIDTTSGPINHQIVVHPKGGNDIAKSVRSTDPAKNPKSIQWNVDINTSLNELNNAQITDQLPEGLQMSESVAPVVQVLKINNDGNITGVETTLIADKDYTVDAAGKITLIGDYAKTNQAFRVIYTTDIEASAIPDKGGNVSFENKAILTNKGEKYPAKATAFVSYGKLLEKSMSDTHNNQKLDWTINYNNGDKKLSVGTKLIDKLTGDQKYDGQPTLVYLDGPSEGKEVPTSDYNVDYDKDGKGMMITFTNGLDQAVKITYSTKVTGPIKDLTDVNNSVSSNGETVDVGKQPIKEQGIIKGLGAVDYNQKTVGWNVTINSGRQDMKNWSAEDTLPAGLTLNKESVKLTDTDTNNDLVLGKDYQINDTPEDFKIEFLGELKNSASHEYKLTYTTSFDTSRLGKDQKSWTNKINATWTDINGDEHNNEGKATFTPKNEYVSNATKSGSYNATNKHITWTVVVNYNQRELKTAQIVDKLEGDPTYVPGSAKLKEATIKSDGSYTAGNDVTDKVHYDPSSKTITANLPDGNSAYVLTYETSLEGKVIDQKSYDNTAIYTNNGQNQDVNAQVSVPNSGEVAYKTGQQDPDDSSYALWDIYVNREQSTLNNVTVTDYPTGSQYIEKDNVHVYGTKISQDGKSVSIDKSNELKQGVDYTVDIETNQTTGVQTMIVKFKNEISTSYVVEYRSLITTPEASATLGNTADVTATGLKEGGKTVEKDIVVQNSGGSSTGTSYNYQLTKVDKDHPDKVLPGVTFELWTSKLENGQRVKGQVFRTSTTDKDGQVQWNNLKAGTYFLVEKSTLPSYQKSADKKIIIDDSNANSDHLVPETVENEKVKTSVSGTKTWNDKNNQDGKRPSQITVNLLANGDKVKDKKVQAGTDGKWKYDFTNLDKFDADGKEINYTVSEDEVPDYDEPEIDGYNITNTHEVAKIDVSGHKTWNDKDNQDGIRPSQITIHLLADDKDTGQSQVVTAENGWEYNFKNLDKYKDGKEITYSVKEDPVAKYTPTPNKDGYGITNNHTPETFTLNGKKTWNDNNDQDGNRPDSITIHLLKNGKEIDSKKVTAKDNWEYSFKDLDKNVNGKEAVYKVTEDNVPDYSSDVSDNKNIVNNYTPDKTSATVTKSWNDANDQDGLRKNVKVQLYANDKAYGEPVELSEDQNWTYTWSDLNQRQGKKDIKYTVKEVDIPDGYTSEVNNDNQGNMIITNTHKVAKTNVSGQKTWKDNDDQDGKRPNKITVNLLADGQKVASQTVTAKDDWKYDFTDLDKFKNGKEIKYAISENRVDGYTTQVDGYDLINTLEDKDIVPNNHSKNNKNDHPRNSQDISRQKAKKHGISAFLPKTGEMNSENLVMVGILLAMIILGTGAYIFSKKNRNKE